MCNLKSQKIFKLTHILGHKMTPKILLCFTMPAESLSVSRISSTHTVRITKPDLVWRTKTMIWMTLMKINARDGDAQLLKPCSWTLLEFIFFFHETTNFILFLSNIPPEVAPYIPPSANHHIKKHFWHPARTRVMAGWQQENRVLMEFNWATGEKVSK